VPANLTDRPWWLEPLSEAAGDLFAEVYGLSSRDAKAQLGRFGPNLFRERQEKSLLVQYETISVFLSKLFIVIRLFCSGKSRPLDQNAQRRYRIDFSANRDGRQINEKIGIMV